MQLILNLKIFPVSLHASNYLQKLRHKLKPQIMNRANYFKFKVKLWFNIIEFTLFITYHNNCELHLKRPYFYIKLESSAPLRGASF